MIRLHCYPADDLSLVAHPPVGTPLLSCIVHTGTLSAQHHLEVWIGGQRLVCEGEQEVFSWQCAAEVEMEIRLIHNGRTLKAWRGWWRGERSIVHTGTLPLQVFLGGQLQPALSPQAHPTSVPLRQPGTVDQHNGTSALHPHVASTATAVLEQPADQQSQPIGRESPGEEGDLWDVDLAATWPGAHQREEEEEEGQESEENDDDGEEEECSEAVSALPPPPLVVQEPPPAAEAEAGIPASPTIAAIRAFVAYAKAEHEQALQHLASLLSSMPARTILIDLRKHSPAPRTRTSRHGPRPTGAGASLGLTKETLRALYGARYWERGGIPTKLHQVSTHPARWHLVISNPQAEGLQELLSLLSQGFSLVILDSEASYEGSMRAAVITFLRERFPQVTVGECS